MDKRPEHHSEQHCIHERVHEPIVKFDETPRCIENKNNDGGDQDRMHLTPQFCVSLKDASHFSRRASLQQLRRAHTCRPPRQCSHNCGCRESGRCSTEYLPRRLCHLGSETMPASRCCTDFPLL